tara:strand:+ start:5800 stop:6375 length:576 start_codon:yes stop_codon:yes gene_type:complete
MVNLIIDCENKQAIKETCSILENGGIIVYPTDTLYGFGCDAKNESAIKKINYLKGRTSPMSVLAPNKDTVKDWLNVIESDHNIIMKKLKGASTVIVPVIDGVVSQLVMGENNTLGIRIPNHEFCRNLSMTFPNPITTTSVNRTGQQAMIDPQEILSEFKNDIDLIINDGIIDGVGSTIYLYENSSLTILRS